MAQITSFSQLQEGKEYNVFDHQFNVTNKCRFICHDTTELKRPITYWQFSGYRGGPLLTKERLRRLFDENVYPNAFSMWDFEMNYNTITEIS